MVDIHRLFLSSRADMLDDADFLDRLTALVAASRRTDGTHGLTSCLAIAAGQFALVIEGAEPAVEALLAEMCRDRRGRDIVVLHRERAGERAFPGRPLTLAGLSSRGRRALADLAVRSGGSLAKSDPRRLLALLREVAAYEVTEASVPAGLDVDRLRAELNLVAPGPAPEAGSHVRPEDEALEAVTAVALFSPEGRVVRANPNYCALLGYPADTIVGRVYEDLIASDDVERLHRLWRAMAEGETVTLRHRGLRRDGAELWLESTFRPRLDLRGRLLDVVEIAADKTAKQLQRADDRGQILAINTSQAVIHFDLAGTVLDANPLFLGAMGYTLDEVRGRHHSLFVDPVEAKSEDYRAFWADLAAGRHRAGEYRRLGRDGRPVWLQATYNPIFDMAGRPFKVVKYASVITDAKLQRADYEWQIAAIHKSHAVITFDLGGIILDANDLFLAAMGYDRDEIIGRHHRMFVEPSFIHSSDYADFWRDLGRGRHQTGQFKRRGRGGREVWLQATYSPIFDLDGRPFKVVKYATVITEERLRQAEHQGQIAAIHKAQCVVSFALDGSIIDANDKFLDVTGYRLGDVRGRHHRMFVDPVEAAGPGYAAFWADLAAGRNQGGEYKRVRRDGGDIWFQASYTPIFDMSGRPFRVIEYATDITAEKLQQADFEGQIAAIRTSQCVASFALDGTILDANETMLELLGYALDEVRGRPHAMLIEPGQRDAPENVALWETLRAGSFASGLYKRIGKDGRQVWLQATYNPILGLDARPVKVITFASDVTSEVALAEAYEDAKRQALHDSATALPNRLRLASFMSSALAEPDARLVVVYVDLDRFKPINDTFGHAAGDRVLGEVADRLRRALASDQLVARVGGDEFVVVAPDLPDEQIEAFCQRLIQCATAPIRHEGGELQIGLSMGIAISPADGQTPDDLLRSADSALYRSKQAGRGVYTFYSAAMNDRILSYRRSVDDLRRALAEDEFFLEYQPRFGSRTCEVRSFEALVRWRHPERGRIGPDAFIPLAEKSGLVVELGTWVLRTACEAATRWTGIGVSVNVSSVQFRSGELAETVAAILAETGFAPDRLELELTESVLLEDAGLAQSSLRALKALGVKLAMDDFGTGYSSLSTLRNFPFDVIKIDRRFIADLDDHKGGREVVQAILGLGRALGLSVTAEGVETERQLRALASDHCDEVQGYLLGRPMPIEAVSAFLRDAEDAPEHLTRAG